VKYFLGRCKSRTSVSFVTPIRRFVAEGIAFAIFAEMNAKTLAVGQGVFYLLSGLWPILDIKSFEKVTGPKTDDWLVKTVGALIATTGATLVQTGLNKDLSREAALIGAGHALVLGTVSGYYSTKGRISKIYLLDAFTEYLLVGAWVLTKRPSSQQVAPKATNASAA
jgi:hypothetical protein